MVTQSPLSVACDDSDGASSDVSHAVDNSSSVTLVQLQDMVDKFKKNLEYRFFDVVNNKIGNLSQDVHNRSLTALTVVARRADPTPDRPSLALNSDGLEGNLGVPAASEAPTVVDYPTHIEFGVFLARVRELEFQHGYLPDSFLTSLRGKVIYAADHSLLLSGDSIADSDCSYRLRVFGPRSPAPGWSRDGDSIIPFVRSLLGVATHSVFFQGGWRLRCSLIEGFVCFFSLFFFLSCHVCLFSHLRLFASSLSSPFPGLVAGSLPGSVASCVAPVTYSVSRSVSFSYSPPVVWPVAFLFVSLVASSVAGSFASSGFSLLDCPSGGLFSSDVTPSVTRSVASSVISSSSSSFAMSSLLAPCVSSFVLLPCSLSFVLLPCSLSSSP